MGAIIMLILSLVVAGLVKFFTGGLLLGIFSGLVFLVLFFLFNIRAGTSGLVKANLSSYFTALTHGATHPEAAEHIINSRYPISESNRATVRTQWQNSGPYKSDEDSIHELVYTIFEHEIENKVSPDWQTKVRTTITKIYEEMKQKKSNQQEKPGLK